MSFTTALTPTAGRGAFLADTSCSPDTDDPAAVVCTSGKDTVHVWFETGGGSRARGELSLP